MVRNRTDDLHAHQCFFFQLHRVAAGSCMLRGNYINYQMIFNIGPRANRFHGIPIENGALAAKRAIYTAVGCGECIRESGGWSNRLKASG